jgi:hypothetical protein
MRSQGVPNFPDPEPSQTNAKFPSAQQLGVSSSLYQTAENACQHLLPSGGGSSQAGIQQELAGLRSFAQCMRGHGVPNWPDPAIGSQGKPSFDLTGLHGVDTPQATAAMRQCGHLLPSQLGGIPVVQ